MAKCTICIHPDLDRIDAALLAGSVPIRKLSEQYTVGRAALTRHKANHIRKALQAANSRQKEDLIGAYRQGMFLVWERIQQLLDSAQALVDKGGQGSASALRGAAGLAREARHLHNDVAKALGVIGQEKSEEARVQVGRAVIVCPPSLPPGSPCNIDADYWRAQGYTGPDEDDAPSNQPALPPATIETVPSPGGEDDPGPLESGG